MLNSTAVQIMLLFGVIIASGLLLTLVNDLIVRSVQTRSNSVHRVVNIKGRRSSARTYTRVTPAKKSYATVNALRVPVTPTIATTDSRDFKVITVRMRNSLSTEKEFSKAA